VEGGAGQQERWRNCGHRFLSFLSNF
jgi:hypothetical protein